MQAIENNAAGFRMKTKASFESVRKDRIDSGKESVFIPPTIRASKRISVFQDEKFEHVDRIKPDEFLSIRRKFSWVFT